MTLTKILSLSNNYIWVLYNKYQECLLFDPGESEPALQFLFRKKFNLKGILLTHHHSDHIGGVKELLTHFPVPVYGPKEIVTLEIDHIVSHGDVFTLCGLIFSVIALPGHTLGHVGFYSIPWLFCGDTVFSAGCGRLFEGTPKQMYSSFQKINQLPAETVICGAHEYTLSNIAFSNKILPNNKFIRSYQRKIYDLMLRGKSSLPTTLQLERKINLFFQCHDVKLQNKLNVHFNELEEWRVFDALRKKKDTFS